MNDERLTNLRAEFKKLDPWITKFHLHDEDFGGNFDALNDVRIGQFFDTFPRVESIVELGSLEGGHSFALAGNPAVQRVLAIEGRAANIAKAKLVQEVLEDKRSNFSKRILKSWISGNSESLTPFFVPGCFIICRDRGN
jgi:hypothetical protein